MTEKKENKVQFNLHNCYYAKILTTEPAVTFDTPVHVPGAVSLTLAQVGEIKKFWADGIPYWQGAANSGYEGDMELARVPEQMLVDIWGSTKDPTSNVLVESSNDITHQFAWLFQIDGDETPQLYLLYNCTATRPGIDAKTNEETKEPQPQKLKFSAAALNDGRIKACTTADTPDEIRTEWFSKVWESSAAKAAAEAAKAAAPKLQKETA